MDVIAHSKEDASQVAGLGPAHHSCRVRRYPDTRSAKSHKIRMMPTAHKTHSRRNEDLSNSCDSMIRGYLTVMRIVPSLRLLRLHNITAGHKFRTDACNVGRRARPAQRSLARDNQDETRATIRMRLGRGWPDGARA